MGFVNECGGIRIFAWHATYFYILGNVICYSSAWQMIFVTSVLFIVFPLLKFCCKHFIRSQSCRFLYSNPSIVANLIFLVQPSNGREWLLKPPLLELDLQGSRQSMNGSLGQLVCVSPKLMWLTQNWNVLSTWTLFLWRKTQMVRCTLLLVLWQGEQLLRYVKHFCQSLLNYGCLL